MTDKEKVFRKKTQFVKFCEQALLLDERIEYLEYKAFPDKYEEFIRIGYPGGAESIICVTANSMTAIMKEIVADISGSYMPIGRITNEKHKEMIRGWWNE